MTRGNLIGFPTSEANVETAERELGAHFPREYRARLIARNGGGLSTGGDTWWVFPVLDASDPKSAARTGRHVVLETEEARKLEGFPRGAVAIAANSEGDLLVLLPGAGGRLDPQVQRWDRETRKCSPVPLHYDD